MVEFPDASIKYPVLPQQGGRMAVRFDPGKKKKKEETPKPQGKTGQYQAQPPEAPPPAPPPPPTEGGGFLQTLAPIFKIIKTVILIQILIAIIVIAVSIWVESGTAGRMRGYLEDFLGGSTDGDGGGGGNVCECTCADGTICYRNSDCPQDPPGVPGICGCPVGC